MRFVILYLGHFRMIQITLITVCSILFTGFNGNVQAQDSVTFINLNKVLELTGTNNTTLKELSNKSVGQKNNCNKNRKIIL